MKGISKHLDTNLARLAWSLWTELGVAGLKRRHQAFSVAPEELILLTSALSVFDPRLRDEALDWCIRYHHFISPIRLHILAKQYEKYIADPFSTFAETFNAKANIRTKWAVLTKTTPLKFHPSGKSTLRDLKTPSMIYLRLRSFFGNCARADVLAFLLTEKQGNFAISDLLEIGYSKRRLAEILADLAAAGVFFETKVRNQLRYTFVRRHQFMKLLGGIPKKMVPWYKLLAVLLPIRASLQEVEEAPIGVRAIDMRNLLTSLSAQLSEIKLTAPPLQNDLDAYWDNVVNWILNFTAAL